MKRIAKREEVAAPCETCRQIRTFVRWVDGTGRTVDTAHGMLFNNGWMCDECLGGSAASDTAFALRTNPRD